MKPFLDSLEDAYAGLEGKGLAEVEYLMGRMYRALNDDTRALEFQEKALACDPEFGPSRFERALLKLRRHLGTGESEEGVDLRRDQGAVEDIYQDLNESGDSPTVRASVVLPLCRCPWIRTAGVSASPWRTRAAR